MNSLRNRVQLIGNPGADPEVKTTTNGQRMAKFRIATSESYKNQQGDRIQETQWHNIIAWGKAAELVERFVKKGNEVGLEGKLTTRSYENTKGEKRNFTEVVLQELLLLPSRNGNKSE